MKIQSLCAAGLVAGAMFLGATPSFAYPPPPPHHGMVAPGMMVCPRCDGYRRVPSGFLGWKDKRCPECDGTGVVRVRGHRTPPPPPPHVHKPAPPKHHAKPVPPPKHHAKPAPKPAPRPVTPPRGKPMPKKHGTR